MTREEAIRLLDLNREYLKNTNNIGLKDDIEALEMAIKALEQEPKTGHWIGIDEEPHEVWECDNCGFVIDGSGCIDPYDYRDTYKFCPNCGAKMVEPTCDTCEYNTAAFMPCNACEDKSEYEPQESEDQE